MIDYKECGCVELKIKLCDHCIGFYLNDRDSGICWSYHCYCKLEEVALGSIKFRDILYCDHYYLKEITTIYFPQYLDELNKYLMLK
jgi:hypothetical protein